MTPAATAAPTAHERLDNYRLDERCAADQIAEVISLHLYGKHYDEIPRDQRAKVEGAALHAIRAAQLTWNSEASARAIVALDQAMCSEMGLPYAGQPLVRRQQLALIGATVVQAALTGTLDLSNPFNGPGEALRVYDAAAAQAQEVR